MQVPRHVLLLESFHAAVVDRDTRRYTICDRDCAIFKSVNMPIFPHVSRAFSHKARLRPGRFAKQESTDSAIRANSHFTFNPNKTRIRHALIDLIESTFDSRESTLGLIKSTPTVVALP
jgi:hypothetical protein